MASLNIPARKRRKTAPAQLPPQATTSASPFAALPAHMLSYPSNILRTHEGAPAATIPIELQLRRAVCSCLLWEDTFYESGQTIADRIDALARQVPAGVLARLAVDARSHFNLRHVPLLLASVLCRTGSGSRLVADTICDVIQRADELTELVAVYARVNKQETSKLVLSAQLKKGLALAFTKFDRYELGKYFSVGGEKGQPIRARDLMFMARPKPQDEAMAERWKRLAAKEHVKEGGADTWETNLMKGADKRETFERQLRDGKLGYLALLRNLRNMIQANVDHDLITQAILARKGARRVLPFRYVAAARACPEMIAPLDTALQAAVADMPGLPGSTVVLVDVSGSMDSKMSAKSDLDRIDAAATLAAVIPGDCQVFTFSHQCVAVGQARGLAGIEAIKRSQQHGGTSLGQAVAYVNQIQAQRLIVITDEQAHDHVPQPTAECAYLINVAPYRNGVGYGGRWTHIDGFSEQAIRFIAEFEKLSLAA